MSFDYINEAFKRLEALNEDMFDTSLTGLNNLSSFMDQDDASDIVKVIDPTAETEDTVSDSYVGKVIINCNVCHSHIFESKEDVVIDEDGVVNPEMQCPYCGEMSGFTVIGEIMPFEQTADQTPAEDPAEEIPAEDTTAEDPAEDPVVEDAEKPLDEGFNFDTVMSDIETLKGFLRSKGHACKSKEAITYLWSVIDLFEAGDQELSLENIAQWYEDTCRNFPEDLELFESCEVVDESVLTEDVNNVNVETDDSVVNVHTEDNGKVVVTTEPKTDAVPAEGEEMTISPVSDETVADIAANNDIESEPLELGDEEVAVDELDFDIDEVDEEGLDELGESYLKNIYENVESFKTTSVSTSDTQMIVEGVITFNSGVKKTTGFIFESHSASKDGYVKFVGKNEHFSKSEGAFALTGKVAEKKLLPESLSYNYKVGDQTISGTVNKQ